MASERRRLHKQQRLMTAELIGTMLDLPQSKGLDPELRRGCERMMTNTKALDELILYFQSLSPPGAMPPGAAPADRTMVAGMCLEWMRRVEEHEREGI
jgi:hypothetical protein